MRAVLVPSFALLLASCASPAPAEPAPEPSTASAAIAPAPPIAITPPAAAPSVAAPIAIPPPGRRIYAKTRFVWVHYEPNATSGWLGFLWLGGYADVKGDGPVQGGPGCNAWYAVEPRGFVCADGSGATTDADDPVLRALRPFAPDLSSPWPHHYGESRSAERYREIPSEKDQRAREWELVEHRAHLAELREGKTHPSVEGVDLTPGDSEPLVLPTLPSTLREQRRRMLPLSTVAWSRDVLAGDRSFLLTADLMFVPKDRVAPYPRSDFAGVVLGDGGETLPLAFFRGKARPKHRLGDDGAMIADGEWPRLAHVGLTGESRDVGGQRYLATREAGLFVLASDATVVKARDATPWGAPMGEADASGKGPGGRQTWLDASILGGWLVAYEGTRAVYATLISPGRGGLPEKGKDEISTASTPVGSWPISGKFATATMVAPGEFIHSDVPWTQNFHGPHALHAAYWHDAFGEKKSAGCINVSPIDGKWLYDWTEPRLPAGWHGIRFEPGLGPATWIFVHSLPRRRATAETRC